MKKLTLLTAILGLFTLSAIAQQQNVRTITVKGYVQDAEGQSLQGAVIRAVSESASTKAGADGKFQLDVTSYCKYVEASYEGYVTTQAEIDGSMIIFRLNIDKKYAKNKEKAAKAAQKEAAEKAKAAEAARIAAEQEAARLIAEREAARIAAEQEAARIAAEKVAAEEAARLAAEQEKQRLIAEAKAKAAEEARIAAEKAAAEEAARIAAEQEKQRLIAEAKAKAVEEARIAAEKAKAEEAARIAAEQEKQRLLAEAKAKAEEDARIAAEKEKARIIAEAKKQAEEERARIIAEAKAQAQAEAARLAAQQQSAQVVVAPQPAPQQVVAQPAPQSVVQQPVVQQQTTTAAPVQQPQVVAQQTSQKYETASNRDEDMVPLEKKSKKPLKKNRFGQMLEFGFMATARDIQNIEALDMAVSLNYAIGCNFNNMVFLGVGTGIIWNIDGGMQEMDVQGGPSGGSSSYYPDMEIGALPLAKFSVPAYLHFKVNMSRDTKVAPYFALTAGAEIAPIREEYNPTPNHRLSYNQMSIFGKASLGVNFRIGDKSAMYIGIGYRIDNRYGARLFSGDPDVYAVRYWVHGLTANLGFLF